MYTDNQKQEIFTKWSNYQKSCKMPVPEYSYQAYTDSVYTLWNNVMSKEGY